MTLTRSQMLPVADEKGNVYFAMTDGGRTIAFQATRRYLTSLAGGDRASSAVFTEMRNLVEEAARTHLDLALPDWGLVRCPEAAAAVC